MRNFIIILFVFFLLFLLGSLFIVDLLIIFLMVFLALLISLICLIYYLGRVKGILAIIFLIIMPFLVEYLLAVLKVPFVTEPTIQYLSFRNIELPITINNLFYIFMIPLLFISALFFSQKIKLYANIKTYHKTFIVIVSSLLLASNFLVIQQGAMDWQSFIKWLLIALVVNFLLFKLYAFKIDIPEIYKELPIVLFLAIYGVTALRRLDYLQLAIVAVFITFYLLILYNEYKIRKISQQTKSFL